MEIQEGQRRRVKQKDLVALLFVLFSEEYDRTEADSITDIEIPMAEVRKYLASRVGTSYSSDAWITTQIHKYEEELGTRLFRKADSPAGPALGLCREIFTYEQKRHLYVTQKIRTANGVFDLIRNSQASYPAARSVRVLLEAGSTVTRVADIIALNLAQVPWTWAICTHNLGVIECLGKTGPGYEKASISVPQGRFDPATNLILGENLAFYLGKTFDWIIQGTSFLSGGVCFVERADEAAIKSGILHDCRGSKVLVLTGHEAAARPPEPAIPFGSTADFDFIIHPALPQGSAAAARLAAQLDSARLGLSVMIRDWSYEILKTGKAARPSG
ncbi:MAG TPA: DeoR family transcriptional regulator [Treponema sp.]|nr:MAG: hypothetical protein A2Y36_08250 [Treponema sp. GWA1_62_8]OHE64787.1 MAG: hypothetical protein A2001_04550 [Treponema sp. GWC1_61_84]HCM27631.1 DeoR family transcriptional regulator [Treponema sp.]